MVKINGINLILLDHIVRQFDCMYVCAHEDALFTHVR